jgi:hypothetical protein
VPGGWALGQPGIDVSLNAGGDGPAVGEFEPGEEFDGFGDFLLCAVHGALGWLPVCRECPDAAQVVPAGEGLDGTPNLGVINALELAG